MNIKNNIDNFSLLSIIYDVESHILTLIKNKIQNFIFSINKLFINNIWYNNHILKYINFILSKKIYPIIISGLIFIKSKISPFQLISEEYLNINIKNKNKFILFLLFNSFEALIIKYIDTFFSICYSFFFNKQYHSEKINYYGKCIKNIFKHLKNIQNIILGMVFYKSFLPKDNNVFFDILDEPIKLISYGFIIKNTYNIFQNIKNIFSVYYIDEKKENIENDDNKNYCEDNTIYNENENDDDNENKCLLCLNKYNQVCCTPCGHLFCWSCIHLYLSEKNNCPKCKKYCKSQEILFLQNYLNY